MRDSIRSAPAGGGLVDLRAVLQEAARVVPDRRRHHHLHPQQLLRLLRPLRHRRVLGRLLPGQMLQGHLIAKKALLSTYRVFLYVLAPVHIPAPPLVAHLSGDLPSPGLPVLLVAHLSGGLPSQGRLALRVLQVLLAPLRAVPLGASLRRRRRRRGTLGAPGCCSWQSCPRWGGS